MKPWLGLIGFYASSVFAGPTLYADPYPANQENSPTGVFITVNGTAGPPCTLPFNASGALLPTCDLTPLRAGRYTITMTAVRTTCTVLEDPTTCTTITSDPSQPLKLLITRKRP